MRLLDLDPAWLFVANRRVGFVFRAPSRPDSREWWQSCFPVPPSVSEQLDLFDAAIGDDVMVQPCNPKERWAIAGGIEAADFASITVTPSLDGSAGGLWHGFITGGRIVGGI